MRKLLNVLCSIGITTVATTSSVVSCGNFYWMKNFAQKDIKPAIYKISKSAIGDLTPIRNNYTTKGSNIVNGSQGKIFQTSDNILWSVGNSSRLQYFDKKEQTWKSDTSSGLTKGSNIVNGSEGNIFESTNAYGTKTLWSMGTGTTLQYWDADAGTWKSDPTSGLTKGSNITDGSGGTIFQSTNSNGTKTLWSMGNGTPLQYWNSTNQTWQDDKSSGLTKGSNITNGSGGFIFESSNEDGTKTLWSAGYGTELQYFDTSAGCWKHNESSGLTKGSNIIDGAGAKMFQSVSVDGTKILWSMSYTKPLQYWDSTNKTWQDDKSSGLTKGSNIGNGFCGTMFQSDNGILWSIGYKTSLQYWNDQDQTWEHNQSFGLTNGSNITDGFKGSIFQDSSGLLWSAGNGTKLQYWDEDTGTWKSDTSSGLTKGSNITSGLGIQFFQSTDRTLWTMSYQSKLQYFNFQNLQWEENIK